jgi:tetratricopeptide (TPR) repeat protein
MLGLANVLFDEGQLAKAGALYSDVASVYESIGDLSSQATSLNNRASVHYELGEIEQAAALDQQALEIRRSIGDKKGVALSLLNLGEVHLNAAHLSEAEKHYQEARLLNEEMGDRVEVAYTLVGLARLSWVRNDVDRARQMLRECIELRQSLGLTVAAAEARSILAELELSEGRVKLAVEEARRAFDEIKRTAADSREMTVARSTLIVALTAVGRSADAAGLFADSDESRIEGLSSRLHFSIARARLRASQGHASEAVRSLESVEKAARRGGLQVLAWESALAAAGVLLEGARPAEARRVLESVSKEAARLRATHYVVRANRLGGQGQLDPL